MSWVQIPPEAAHFSLEKKRCRRCVVLCCFVFKLGKFHVQVHVHLCSGNVHTNDCGSAHWNGCVVNGISARTACCVLCVALFVVLFVHHVQVFLGGLTGGGIPP